MLQPYPKYKAIDLLWLKEIPAHWKPRSLSNLASEYFVSNKNMQEQNLLSLSYGRIIRKNINTTEGLLPASYDTYQIVEKGNIIIRPTDLQNDHRSLRVGLANERGIITSAYIALKCTKEVIPEYLYLLLHTYDLHKIFYGMGGGMRQSLKWQEFRKLNFYIPPKDEQEKIVAYLDGKIAKIDKYITAETEKKKLLHELKNAEISQAVTRGLNPNVKYKAIDLPWLKEIPEHWELKRTKTLFFNPKELNVGLKCNNLLSLTMKGVVHNDMDNPMGLSPESYESYQIFHSGDLVFKLIDLQNIKTSRVGLVPEKGIMSSAYIRFIKRDRELCEKYYYYYYTDQYNKCIFNSLGDGVRSTLSANTLLSLYILFPPKDEQKEIVAYLDERIVKIDKAISAIQKRIDLMKEYKSSLISSVVTGKVMVS